MRECFCPPLRHMLTLLLNPSDRTFLGQWCVRCITTAANSCNLSALKRSKTLIGSFVPWLLVLMLFFPSVSVVLSAAAIRARWWGHCNCCHAEGAMCAAVCLQASLSPALPAASSCAGYRAELFSLGGCAWCLIFPYFSLSWQWFQRQQNSSLTVIRKKIALFSLLNCEFLRQNGLSSSKLE